MNIKLRLLIILIIQNVVFCSLTAENATPTRTASTAEQDQTGVQCIICQETCRGQYKILACQHKFHSLCINKWHASQTTATRDALVQQFIERAVAENQRNQLPENHLQQAEQHFRSLFEQPLPPILCPLCQSSTPLQPKQLIPIFLASDISDDANTCEQVRSLINQGCDLDEYESEIGTPLSMAVALNLSNLAIILLEAGASVDAQGATPELSLLLTALHRKNFNLAKKINEHGGTFDLNEHGNITEFKKISMLMCIHDEPLILQILLQNKSTFSSEEQTVLFEYALFHNPPARKVLAALCQCPSHIDINTVRTLGGETVLAAFARKGEKTLVKLLLDTGADPKIGDKYSRPLDVATDPEIRRLLGAKYIGRIEYNNKDVICFTLLVLLLTMLWAQNAS